MPEQIIEEYIRVEYDDKIFDVDCSLCECHTGEWIDALSEKPTCPKCFAQASYDEYPEATFAMTRVVDAKTDTKKFTLKGKPVMKIWYEQSIPRCDHCGDLLPINGSPLWWGVCKSNHHKGPVCPDCQNCYD